MSFDDVVSVIKKLAISANARVGDANWYLFGSTQQGSPNTSDIDLVIVCQTHDMADAFRRDVDLDQLIRPIHLTILTEAEEEEIRFVEKQGCVQVL
jgi:predicted nucleotidyltransferase